MLGRLIEMLRKPASDGSATSSPATASPVIYGDPVRNPNATEFEVDLWILSRFVLDRLLPVIGTQPYPLNELLLMTAAVCRLKPSLIFDWGTHVGASARLFYECARAFDLDVEIHSIDLPPDVSHVEHPGEEHGRLVRGLPRVHLHRGDGVVVALDLWNRLGHRPRPLFFVDGDHEYDSVLRELGMIVDAIPDASVLLHDTLYQSAESRYNVGPAKAVKQILSRCPGRFTVIPAILGLPGMTFLADAATLRAQAPTHA